MKEAIFLLLLAACMGSAHPEGITLLARQNTLPTTAFSVTVSTVRVGSCAANGREQCGNRCADVRNGGTCCDAGSSYRMFVIFH